jgi:dehydrogenase/reductase SDR family protein 1
MSKLSGRVAIVAGASRGIGRGAAVELGAAGATVYALGRTLQPGTGDKAGSLLETAATIEGLGGRCVPIACDCTDEAAVAGVINRVIAEQGRLDVLVNSVFAAPRFGAFIGKRFWETSTDLWRHVVDLGGRSAYVASVLCTPTLIATAQQGGRPGLIINVSGRGAVRYRYNVAYGVGKAATERQTRDMALDLKDHNVAVVSIWPNGHAIDPAKPGTERYNGRGIASLAADPRVMTKSGSYFWAAELGAQYGFTDEFGHTHIAPELTDEYSLEHEAGHRLGMTA